MVPSSRKLTEMDVSIIQKGMVHIIVTVMHVSQGTVVPCI